ncbi:ATP-binding protein [Consotaella salsifontis]|uniref:histidine kinase n=1 Tax=Consotaella salsifontis TaxID=1365950 RepID=A0A1T4S6I9_9HYPH|nr:ATP-binding protein [Consotaella salsifontis]SKA23859.1 Signal transduction histidine kinase [Consotaella salsifontis]
MSRLWPRGLAARLVLLIVATLALAQGALVLVLRDEQDAVVEAMLHGQAVAQAVTLVRLVASSPPEERGRLADAFWSMHSCARVADQAPEPRAMTDAEKQIAEVLRTQLADAGGAPTVAIEPLADHRDFCADLVPEGMPAPRGQGLGRLRRGGGGGAGMGMAGRGMGSGMMGGPGAWLARQPPNAAVRMTVPLADGHWLEVRDAVAVPDAGGRLVLPSFLISSLAVALVVVFAVRAQTRSLRRLADAAERLGRGESVEPLPLTGPAEVVVATRAFNTMQDRLGRFVKDRLRLLAAVSHDLRTPLTTLRLKAEFIDDEEARAGIVATIDELAAITEATLNFTRAEAREEETREIDLAAFVKAVAEEFALAGSKVVAAPAEPTPYPCRPIALKRALSNLVDNAVQYGGGAVIKLTAEADGPVIVVEDDGPGLPEERIEEAFQPFVRLETSRSRDTGGLGLGLATALGIVQAHGGSLTLSNRAEGGLAATIRLPPRGGH